MCSTLFILRSFSTSISPSARNIIYYNLHALITVIWTTSGAERARNSSHLQGRIKLDLRPVLPSDIVVSWPIASVRPNENYTNDPSSSRLEMAQRVHLINYFSCISLPTMTKHYVNGEYMLWKQLRSVVLYVDKRKPILDRLVSSLLYKWVSLFCTSFAELKVIIL